MKVLVTGGQGYIGCLLTRRLIESGHTVVCIDANWFGDNLGELERLEAHEVDLRKIRKFEDFLVGVEVIYHLANVANDPAVDLAPELSWETNCLATRNLLEAARLSSTVKKFFFASSGSVYGVRPELHVTEETPLTPISVYNKTKMCAERIALSYANDFDVYVVRPATVCGLSDRMRLDVSVNVLTWSALTKGKVTVFGGDQIRPNIHIDDMVSTYFHLLTAEPGIYNAGFENISIGELAKAVSSITGAPVETIEDSNDPRSYRLNSEKLLGTGFVPTKTVDHAIEEIRQAYAKGSLEYSSAWFTVERMKELVQSGGIN